MLLGPQMEHYAQFWTLYFEKDVAELENIQKSVWRMIRGLEKWKTESWVEVQVLSCIKLFLIIFT